MHTWRLNSSLLSKSHLHQNRNAQPLLCSRRRTLIYGDTLTQGEVVPSTAKRAQQRWGALELVHNGSGPHQENTIRCYSEFLEFFNRQATFLTKTGLSGPLKKYTTTQQGAQKESVKCEE